MRSPALERLLEGISGDATSSPISAARSQPSSSLVGWHHRYYKRTPAFLAEASCAMCVSRHDVSNGDTNHPACRFGSAAMPPNPINIPNRRNAKTREMVAVACVRIFLMDPLARKMQPPCPVPWPWRGKREQFPTAIHLHLQLKDPMGIMAYSLLWVMQDVYSFPLSEMGRPISKGWCP